jgi:C-terminal processing protease CtpA/Prc
MIRPGLSSILPLLLLAATGVARADGAVAPRSPALQAYDEVTPWRERHGDVIWGEAPATPEQLREALADLDHGLELLDAPLAQDLAEGNIYLRYRRYNFLIDKLIVHARLDDVDAAVADLERMQRMEWSTSLDSVSKIEAVQHVLADPRSAAVAARMRVAQRMATSPALATPYRATLPVDERIAGLSQIWSTARADFVWFDHVPDLDWDRAYRDALPRVIAASDTAAYYRELMRFVALLRDGHSNVYAPEALSSRFYARPGLRTELVEDRVLVIGIADPNLGVLGVRVGDEVVAVDGTPVHDYATREVTPFQSSSTGQDRDIRSFRYALLSGPADRPVALTLRHADGRVVVVKAPRSGFTPTPPRPSETFTLRDDGIAVLAAGQFENDAAARLMDSHADEILSAKGLILDLRGNGGGSSDNGYPLLSWLSERPIAGTVSAVRVNDALDHARQGAGTAMRWRRLPVGELKPGKRFFGGPVVMLIDARTFSAAEDTAAVFRQMHRGTIIGSASGGSTGQPLLFDLPGGGKARICVKRDSYADGSDFVGVGVLPDVAVTPTIASVRAGTDPVLDRALQSMAAER